MKTKIYRFLLIILLGLSVMILGCTMAKISGRGSIPLMLNNPSSKLEVISHFKESKMITFDYTGAFDVYEVLAEKIVQSKADAATNITVTIKSDVGTFFVNLLTFGLANARTVQVEGDFVKASKGLGSLIDSKNILAEAKTKKELKDKIEMALKNNKNITSIVFSDGKFLLVN